MPNNKQITANIGLFHVCTKLSEMTLNVMPTARNAVGIDIVAYNVACTKMASVQVKTVTGKNQQFIVGRNTDIILADFWVFVRYDEQERSFSCSIMTKNEAKNTRHKVEDDKGYYYYLNNGDTSQHKDRWGKITRRFG